MPEPLRTPTPSGHAAPVQRLRALSGSWQLYLTVGLLIALLWALIIWFSAAQKQRLEEDSKHELTQLRNAVARHHTPK